MALPAAHAGRQVVDGTDRILASAPTGHDAPRDLAELCGIIQAERGPVQIVGHELRGHGVVVTPRSIRTTSPDHDLS